MRKSMRITVLFISSVLVFTAGCCVGHSIWKDDAEEMAQTFYAEITSIDGTHFAVEGLAVNDINHRGSFTFDSTDETQFMWRGTEIDVSDLLIGDTISITYNGVMLETYPVTILGVERISLLSDR